MNKKIILAIAMIALATMLVSMYMPVQATTSNTNGARNSEEFVWYPSGVDPAWAALTSGQIDMLDWALTKAQLDSIDGVTGSNPNVQKVQYSSFSLWELDINSNKTIVTYGSSATSPTAYPAVRQAVACVIDKPTAVIAGILDYFGIRIDEAVAAPSTTGWTNTSYEDNLVGGVRGAPGPTGDNYPYEQNYTKAVDYLAGAGFWGDGTWLHYPNATELVTLPNGTKVTGAAIWGTTAGKSTTNLGGGEPLVVVIRNTDPLRLAVGIYVCTQLDGWGNPALSVLNTGAAAAEWAKFGVKGGAFGTTDAACEGPRSYTSPKVMGNHDYNLYTGGWTVGRFPTYDFGLYETMFCYSYGANYVTGTEWALGNPDFSNTQDMYLDNIYYAPTLADSQGNCSLFNGYFIKWCEDIFLWSSSSYNAWYKGLQGVVNMQGTGIINDYTFMNAYETGSKAGTPITCGEPESWTLINPLYSQYVFEQDYLSRIVGGTMSVAPYNIMVDQPWLAQDWQIGTWIDARDNNSVETSVTYWFRKDAGWASPVTGDFGGFFNAYDFAANMWYTYAYPDCWQWGDTMDIDHIIINSPYEATVYFDAYSIWFLYEPTYPIMMPGQVLTADPQLCANATASFLGSALSTPAGAAPGYVENQFTTDSVVSVISATKKNGTGTYELTEGVDYYIRTGYDQQALGLGRDVFVPITPVNPTDNITIIFYYAIPLAASGTYMGSDLESSGVPVSLWSSSYVYPVNLGATSSLLAVNPYFFLPVPLLGEIKWTWFWQGSNKPRSGYYRIDILDVVKCTGSYSHRGDGAYDSAYFPGADLSATDLCHVGILALVSITGKYYETYGTPIDPVMGCDDVGTIGSGASNTVSMTFTGSLPSSSMMYPAGCMNVYVTGGVLYASLNPGSGAWGVYVAPASPGTPTVEIVLDRNPIGAPFWPWIPIDVAVAAPLLAGQVFKWFWAGLVGSTFQWEWWAWNLQVTMAPNAAFPAFNWWPGTVVVGPDTGAVSAMKIFNLPPWWWSIGFADGVYNSVVFGKPVFWLVVVG